MLAERVCDCSSNCFLASSRTQQSQHDNRIEVGSIARREERACVACVCAARNPSCRRGISEEGTAQRLVAGNRVLPCVAPRRGCIARGSEQALATECFAPSCYWSRLSSRSMSGIPTSCACLIRATISSAAPAHCRMCCPAPATTTTPRITAARRKAQNLTAWWSPSSAKVVCVYRTRAGRWRRGLRRLQRGRRNLCDVSEYAHGGDR